MHPGVRDLYKQLLYIGREYPKGHQYFKKGLKGAFMKKKNIPESEIQKSIDHGWFVYKELEALWFLKKYRTLKKNYYDEQVQSLTDKIELDLKDLK
ncbi:hypothetical protein BC833DRAFT_587897 [Globomyces pollinis-pini]|nr:hypothetical protein BC833DRAFT_587897 [Globomyces pollinis-pini]